MPSAEEPAPQAVDRVETELSEQTPRIGPRPRQAMFQAVVYYYLGGRELLSLWSREVICCLHKPFLISLIFCICFINFQGDPHSPFL